MTKQERAKGKALHMVAAASVILNAAGALLKEDVSFYKQKNKSLLNTLLENNTKVLNEYEKTKSILTEDPSIKQKFEELYLKETGRTVEYDSVATIEDMNMIQEIFSLFVGVFVNSDDSDLVRMFVTLNSLFKRELVLNEQELAIYSKKLLNKTVNYEVGENVINETIKEFKNV